MSECESCDSYDVCEDICPEKAREWRARAELAERNLERAQEEVRWHCHHRDKYKARAETAEAEVRRLSAPQDAEGEE